MALLGQRLTDVYLPLDPTDDTGRHVNGRWVPAARALSQLYLTTEPLNLERTGGDRERIERMTGRHMVGSLTVFSETDLPAMSPGTQDECAWVVKRGRVYELVNTGEWEDDSLGHFEYIAALMDPAPTLPEPDPEE